MMHWLFQWFLYHALALIVFMFIVEKWEWKLIKFQLFGEPCDLFRLVGGLVDASFNYTWGTLFFGEWPSLKNPRQITFSQRMQSHYSESGYRGGLSRFICFFIQLALPNHCKKQGA